MKRRLLILLLLLGAWHSMDAMHSCYATLQKDTLRIGNDVLERCFLWNGGALKTISVVDKRNHSVLRATGKQPDFAIAKGNAEQGSVSSRWIESNGVHPGYLCVEVSYLQGSLSIKRIFRVYDNVSAIACDTYLKGIMKKVGNDEVTSNVDRKNIESVEDMATELKTPTLDRLQLAGNHWQTKAVEFFDYTDWNDNLVLERDFIPYRKNGCRGNLLFAEDQLSGNGFFFLKESPVSSTQLHYGGADFMTDFNDFMVVGTGVVASDISKDVWTRLYGCVLGVFKGEERDALASLRMYQKQ